MNIEPPEEPSTIEETPIPPSTPQNVGVHRGGTALTDGLGAWESPAFLQRSRTSFGGLVDTPLDPFVEEDGFVPGKGRKRPRFSMRSNDWRVIDEPESPHEKDGAIDWMEMFEDEISEPEIEDKNMIGDIEAAEPSTDRMSAQETEEAVPGFAESREGMVQPVSESRKASPGPEQVVGSSVQLVEPDVEQQLVPAVPDTRAKGLLNPFIHLPTDTPRLHPIPSPGLPVPSPLVTTNNSNGYFSSFTTSTTQTPTGSLRTTETQTTMTKVEQRPGPLVPPKTSQAQRGPFGPEMSEERASLPEHVPAAQGLGIDAQISGPTIVEKPAEPLNSANTQHVEGFGMAPENDGERNALMAELVLRAEEAARHAAVGYSESELAADEREEGDMGQGYSEEDGKQQDEEEWSEEQESEEDIDEEEQHMAYQGFQQRSSHEGGQVEIIDLDSEGGEETTERDRTRDVMTEQDDEYSSMEDNIDEDHSHYLEDEDGEDGEDEVEVEDEEDDEADDEGAESIADRYEAMPAGLKEEELQDEEGTGSTVDKEEAMSADFEAEESEDDQDIDWDVEEHNERHAGYCGPVSSELGSEEFSDEEEG